MTESFYASVLRSVAIPSDAQVLVVCGGHTDRETLIAAGLKNVTISNLDERMIGDEFAPYAWSFQDAENLSYPDGSFDYVIVHAGLHHCASPHRGLLEMYRVARRGILAFEARDTLLIRTAKKLGLMPEHELAAVVAHKMKFGGVRNTAVPNYVYRWTEREVEKTIHSFAPYARPKVQFFHSLRVPHSRLRVYGTETGRLALKVVDPAIRVVARVFPKQCNLLAFHVIKPTTDSLHPWMKSESELKADYLAPRG